MVQFRILNINFLGYGKTYLRWEHRLKGETSGVEPPQGTIPARNNNSITRDGLFLYTQKTSIYKH